MTTALGHDHSPGPWIGALAIDIAVVLVFAVAGRSSHGADSGLGAILGVAAPFLIGLAAGWLAWVPARRAPITITTGAVVAAATVIVGLVLRRVAWDRGVALSFAIVTALVLGGFFIGWRALWGVGRRDRRRVSEI